MGIKRKSYLSVASDEGWAFCVRCLALVNEQASQWVNPLGEILNSLRYQIPVGGA